jgi:carboxypeptidase Taq
MDQKAEALNRFRAAEEKSKAIAYATSILFWDASTGAPKSGAEARSRSIGTLSGFEYEMLVNDQMKQDLELLSEQLDTLEEIDRRRVINVKKAYDRLMKIPQDEYERFSALTSKSATIWEEAKEASDFERFKPYLEEIVGYLQKFTEYWEVKGNPYDAFIDQYEEGMTAEKLDVFFGTLKEMLVPLIQKVNQKKDSIDDSFLRRHYPTQDQAKLSVDMLDRIGYDRARGMFKESVHPFTMGVDIDDVRLTTHYYENDLRSALLSSVHEGGHALYEQNIDRSLQGTSLATGASLGIHESQSRLFENNLFKSRSFLSFYYPKVKETFEAQLSDVDFEAFYAGLNRSVPSLIRTEADELTYCLHIMVRYEIEVGLLNSTLRVEDLPQIWKEKMASYLGVVPENDAEGVLQDVHWSEGMFGYFPTYAIGSALAAQLEHALRKEVDVDACLSRGDFAPIKAWLGEKVHRFGALKTPEEVVLYATGEPLNPRYYGAYLTKKYSELYGLD